MKELDFDELDRAVSSLMSDTVSSGSDGSGIPKEKLLDIPTSSTEVSPISFGALEPDVVQKAISEDIDDSPLIAPPANAVAPAIRRSGGRFMDVVHPSSDMKTASTSTPMSSRRGVTITPTTPATVPTEPVKVAEPVYIPESPAVILEEVEDTTRDWPDPLELTSQNETPPKIIDEIEETVIRDDEKGTEEVAPLSSPFLTDAKVEKRPLGGPGGFAASNELSDFTGTEVDTSDETASSELSFQTPLPEELQQDLLAIESGEAQKPEEQLESKPASVNESDTPFVPERTIESHPVKALIPDHFTDENVPKGPASIAQQYREEPTTGDQSNGSIYDTDSYHTPLAHPAKKSSGWLWVVWIILILAVGAGIGAALYYLGIVK